MWQRAGLLVARLGICHHLTNHGGNAPPPWASDRGAISIRGDEAHPKCVNLLGLKIMIYDRTSDNTEVLTSNTMSLARALTQ